MLEGRKLEDLNAKQLADVRKNMIGLVFPEVLSGTASDGCGKT